MLCEYLQTGMDLLQTPSKANQLLKSQIYKINRYWVMLNGYETSECLDQPAQNMLFALP